MDIVVGSKVFGAQNDEYEITEILGQGAFGNVYMAVDLNGSKFAVKTLQLGTLDPTEIEALKNEGILATEIDDANVTKVIFFHDGNSFERLPPYILMEYANEGTLEQMLNQRRNENKQLNQQELIGILLQLAKGMNAVNEKLVHRDIKPDNILILDGKIKITDFGLSKVVDAATRTNTFKGISHMMYRAPEVWRGAENTPALDMYSMGIVFFELATLRHPFGNIDIQGDPIDAWRKAHFTRNPLDPRIINPDIQIDISQMILKMLSKRPQDRFSTWDELINTLENTQAANSSTETNQVDLILDTAVKRHHKLQEETLQSQREAEERRENMEIVQYCINELFNPINDLVREFNSRSQFGEIKSNSSGNQLKFFISGQPQANLTITIQPIFEENHKIDGRHIMAWGKVEAPSGKGFNLFLVKENPEDIYGSWYTMSVRHNPVVFPEQRSDRPEPFGFDFEELPDELPKMTGMHVFVGVDAQYDQETIIPFLQELFIE